MDWTIWRMPRGCYKGKTLETIYRCDVNYLMWARDEHPDASVRKAIGEFLREKNQQIIERGKSK